MANPSWIFTRGGVEKQMDFAQGARRANRDPEVD